MNRLPINYRKHCVQDIATVLASTTRSQLVVLAPIGDETTTTVTGATRAENVAVGEKVFSIDYEIIMRPDTTPTSGIFEIAWTFHRSPDALSIETTDVNNSGLARDLIGRYSGNCLYTRTQVMAANLGGYVRGRLKLPKSKRSFRLGDSLVCSTHNHSSLSATWMGKFIYKSYS